MKKIFALVLALLLAMGACAAFAEDAIIIGISGPLTGPYAIYGLAAARGAEIGFCGTKIDAPKCVYREFAQDRLVIVTPNTPEYQQYLETGFPIAQIMKETFISRESGSGTRKETEAFLTEMGIDPSRLNVAIEVQSTENIKQMVSEGLGIAVLSRSAAENYCEFNRLLAFDFDNVSMRRKLYLVRHKNGVLSPIAQAFYSFAEEYYAEAEEHK